MLSHKGVPSVERVEHFVFTALFLATCCDNGAVAETIIGECYWMVHC